MRRFDEDYLARREVQIRKMHELSAIARVVFFLAFGFTAAAIGSFFLGIGPLGAILMIPTLVMWLATAIFYSIVQANKSADREIRLEREQVMRMMSVMGEKPKRTKYVLADDGEMATLEEDDTESIVKGSRRGD